MAVNLTLPPRSVIKPELVKNATPMADSDKCVIAMADGLVYIQSEEKELTNERACWLLDRAKERILNNG